jgi:hypothetical protein
VQARSFLQILRAPHEYLPTAHQSFVFEPLPEPTSKTT